MPTSAAAPGAPSYAVQAQQRIGTHRKEVSDAIQCISAAQRERDLAPIGSRQRKQLDEAIAGWRADILAAQSEINRLAQYERERSALAQFKFDFSAPSSPRSPTAPSSSGHQSIEQIWAVATSPLPSRTASPFSTLSTLSLSSPRSPQIVFEAASDENIYCSTVGYTHNRISLLRMWLVREARVLDQNHLIATNARATTEQTVKQIEGELAKRLVHAQALTLDPVAIKASTTPQVEAFLRHLTAYITSFDTYKEWILASNVEQQQLAARELAHVKQLLFLCLEHKTIASLVSVLQSPPPVKGPALIKYYACRQPLHKRCEEWNAVVTEQDNLDVRSPLSTLVAPRITDQTLPSWTKADARLLIELSGEEDRINEVSRSYHTLPHHPQPEHHEPRIFPSLQAGRNAIIACNARIAAITAQLHAGHTERERANFTKDVELVAKEYSGYKERALYHPLDIKALL